MSLLANYTQHDILQLQLLSCKWHSVIIFLQMSSIPLCIYVIVFSLSNLLSLDIWAISRS